MNATRPSNKAYLDSSCQGSLVRSVEREIWFSSYSPAVRC